MLQCRHMLQASYNPWRFCIAPMIDWTDRHYRYFMRLLARHMRLYTEMITTGALIYGDPHRFLHYHPSEQPLALQLGGSCPKALAQCAKLAESYGYSEVNLNVGCPSARVQSGKFGACLMAEPALVAECIVAMREACGLPITVKTRLGIDEQDSYAFLQNFIHAITQAGCQTVMVHARKAWLKGLSPKENREIPPLCYEPVHQLKHDFPQICWVINGGITTFEQMAAHLQQVDGVMIGRAAYYDPYLFSKVDALFFGAEALPLTRHAVLSSMLPYIDEHLTKGARLHDMTRHLLNLFHGQPGARQWRRMLSEAATKPSTQGMQVLQQAIKGQSVCVSLATIYKNL